MLPRTWDPEFVSQWVTPHHLLVMGANYLRAPAGEQAGFNRWVAAALAALDEGVVQRLLHGYWREQLVGSLAVWSERLAPVWPGHWRALGGQQDVFCWGRPQFCARVLCLGCRGGPPDPLPGKIPAPHGPAVRPGVGNAGIALD